MSTKKISGICRLTGVHGQYVDSHIIPRALTRLSKSGERTIEAGIGLGKKMRYESWFDNKLVIRAGEDILSKIDARAIKLLREKRLVWSGWGTGERLKEGEFELLGNQAGIRMIDIENPEVLQIFFLSLLWRAAASKRPEFSEIVLDEDELENLRLRILNLDPAPSVDFPILLFQLVTRGFVHNRTPLLERKIIPTIDRSNGPEIAYVRFYFDGLVAHVHLARAQSLSEDFLMASVGHADHGKTLIFSHRFEDSRTLENIKEMVVTVEREGR